MSYIYENFKLYCPSMAKTAVEHHEVNSYELQITADDGNKYLFDNIDKTIRRLPIDSNNMTDEECQREFGLRLRSVMRNKNVTQAELSEMTGIPQPVISNYIMGKRAPSFLKLDKITKALNCSADELQYR